MGGFSRPIPQRLKGITVFAAGAKCPGGILLEKGRAMGNTVAVEVANMLAAAWLMLSSLFYSLPSVLGQLSPPADGGRGTVLSGLGREGRSGSEECSHRTESAAGGAHYEKQIMRGEIFYGGQKRQFCPCASGKLREYIEIRDLQPGGVKPLPGCIV